MIHYDAAGEVEWVDGPGYCGDCGLEWTARGAAHCPTSLERSFSLRDCDPKMGASFDALALEDSPDLGRVAVEANPDFLAGQAAEVKPSCFFRVDPAVVRFVGSGEHHLQIVWSVVGLDAIDVVNLVLTRRKPNDSPVLVAVNLGVRAVGPLEPDIAIGSQVSRWALVREGLTESNLSPRNRLPKGLAPEFPTGTASDLSSAGSLHEGSTVATMDGGPESLHNGILQCITHCCRHFTSDSGFDRHRRDGVCQDPATLLVSTTQKPIFEATASGAWKQTGDRPAHWLSKTAGHDTEATEPDLGTRAGVGHG